MLPQRRAAHHRTNPIRRRAGRGRSQRYGSAMALDTWLVYLLAATGLSLSPGPNGLLALTHGALHGTRQTLFTIAGGALGFTLLIALSMFGIGALLQASLVWLTVLKWLGGAYLVWLGVQVWRAPPLGAGLDAGQRGAPLPAAGGRLFRQGALSALTNPKGLLFFAAFLPQFIDPARSLLVQFAVMAGTFAAIEIADAVVAAVREELPHAQLNDPESARAAVLRKLAAYIPASDTPPEPVRGRDGRPTTIALIGPTGVGKTTTIAKLAATYKLRMGKRVGLVTGDTYRIAAVEQLRTYAGIIGLPLRVALTPAEMRAGCEALNDCDVILVDTAGRAPSDSGKVSELGAFLDAALPHQVHLVLSSTASEACMRHAVASFAPVGPTHLIYTKLDEAVSFGVLVNIARKVNAKLSFVTTGQEVPDQIEAGDAHRLATLILEGGTVR